MFGRPSSGFLALRLFHGVARAWRRATWGPATLPAAAAVLAACAGAGYPRANRPAGAQAGRDSGAHSVDVVIAATTDVHGRLRGWDYYANARDSARGLARAATVVDSVRAANPGRVILVDAGDLLQGNPLTYVAAVFALIVTGVIACALPARQAARVDPVTALRGD